MRGRAVSAASRLRFVIGCAQMFGASLGILLLATSGLSTEAVGVAVGTTALTVLSRVLFARGRRAQRRADAGGVVRSSATRHHEATRRR